MKSFTYAIKDRTLVLPYESGTVSDGYHTFNELYEHRCLLFLNLILTTGCEAFKTLRDDLGNELEGWFIAGLKTKHGQISYQ